MSAFGINFRATSGFVTDNPPDTYCIGDAYPTTRGGVTFGFSVNVGGTSTRDRNSAVNPFFAGINSIPNNSPTATFRIDLPNTGAWDIHASFGDVSNQQIIYIDFRDNTTSFATLSGIDTTGANNVSDAVGNVINIGSWVASNVKVTHTFTSTIFNIVMGNASTGALNTAVTHIGLVPVSSATLLSVNNLATSSISKAQGTAKASLLNYNGLTW
jgi:hypothetical protein